MTFSAIILLQMAYKSLSHLDSLYSPFGTSWDLFKYHNEIPSTEGTSGNIKILLPSGSFLYVSHSCVFSLKKLDSHLTCNSRNLMDGNSNVFNFKNIDMPEGAIYGDDEVVALFYMLSRSNVTTYRYKSVTVSKTIEHELGLMTLISYATATPSLLCNYYGAMFDREAQIPHIDVLLRGKISIFDLEEQVSNLATMVKVLAFGARMDCVDDVDYSYLRRIVWMYPWSICQMGCRDQLIVIAKEFASKNPTAKTIHDILGREELITYHDVDIWSQEELKKYQDHRRHVDIETEINGIKMVRIPAVARDLGFEFTEADAMETGRTIAAKYREAYHMSPNKITVEIQGTSRNINCYRRRDYDLIKDVITEYMKTKSV